MKKILACLLVVCMLVTLMPFTAFAEGEIVDEAGLKAAAATGGEITTGAFIDIAEPIVVEKDLTIHVGGTIQQQNADGVYQAEALFIVKGAKLTIYGTDGQIQYAGAGSTFVLQDGASLELNGGTYIADRCFWNDNIPTSLIAAESGTSAVLVNGGFNCYVEGGVYIYEGAVMTGEGSMTILGGSFCVDPTPYLGENAVAIYELDQWKVLLLAAEYSKEFAAILDEDQTLPVKRYQPTQEEGTEFLVEALYMMHYDEETGPLFSFYGSTYDYESNTICVSNRDLSETHRVKLKFVYDAAIKEQVDALIETLPEGTYHEEEDYYEPYFFQVSDLELFNYWMTCNESNDWFNVNNLINYSAEFKELIDYRNYRLDARAGDGGYFFTMAYGIADFSYDGTVYASNEIGVNADHILYVSSGLTTEEEMLAAAQKRLDNYFGTGKVVVEQLTDEEKIETGYTDPVDCSVFKTTINDQTYYFKAVPDSTKWIVPSYRNVDVLSEVEVRSDSTAEFPLDAMIAVEQLTEGMEYEWITSNLNLNEHETYDINLFSDSTNDYVTKLERGSFEVQIPITETLIGKDLAVYYVDVDGNVEEYEVTVKDGKASFLTDHFSAYTLATPVELPEAESHNYVWNEETGSYVCECGVTYIQTLDLDGDGSATTADAIQLLRTIDRVGDLPAYLADINSDGKVKVFDAVRYLQLLNS